MSESQYQKQGINDDSEWNSTEKVGRFIIGNEEDAPLADIVYRYVTDPVKQADAFDEFKAHVQEAVTKALDSYRKILMNGWDADRLLEIINEDLAKIRKEL